MSWTDNYCNNCHTLLVERPLFTSTYKACPRCEPMERKEPEKPADEPKPKIPSWSELKGRRIDFREMPSPKPCYGDIHLYVAGDKRCTCGTYPAPAAKTLQAQDPYNLTRKTDGFVMQLPPGVTVDTDKLQKSTGLRVTSKEAPKVDEWRSYEPTGTAKTCANGIHPYSPGSKFCACGELSSPALSSFVPKFVVQLGFFLHCSLKRGDVVEAGGVRFVASKTGVYQISAHRVPGKAERVLVWHRLNDGPPGSGMTSGTIRVPA